MVTHKKVMKGSVQDIIENSPDYTYEENKFAKYMKSRFEEQGAVEYNKEGMETVASWVKDYIKIVEESEDVPVGRLCGKETVKVTEVKDLGEATEEELKEGAKRSTQRVKNRAEDILDEITQMNVRMSKGDAVSDYKDSDIDTKDV